MKKRKNSGFSLVEMIVVVLIMGIITVSLAPQVMKWVGKAKESADFQAQNGIKETAQVALAEFESTGAVLADEDYNVTSSGVSVAGGGTDNNSGMKELLVAYMHGTYPKVQAESGKVFQIQMRQSGKKVTVTTVSGTY